MTSLPVPQTLSISARPANPSTSKPPRHQTLASLFHPPPNQPATTSSSSSSANKPPLPPRSPGPPVTASLTMEPSQDAGTAIRFRPSKKRKAYRQRADDSPPSTTLTDTQPPEQTTQHGQQEEAAESVVTTAMRIRNARRARLRGVEFTSDDHDAPTTTAPADEDKVPAKGIPDRFTHQTGLVATLNDRYMNEYIESRLSTRAPGPSQPSPPTEASADAPAGAHAQRPHDQSTKHGRLLEVDVPADARRDSRKRPPDTEPPRPKRGRGRRGSDDIKRDQLVEAFLHENKLDVYDVPVQNSPANGVNGGDGRSADDRMADDFRKRYMDEVAARRLKRRPAPTTKQKQQQQLQQADVLRGPKLGGSRNVRAAARDILLKEKKEKEKSARRP